MGVVENGFHVIIQRKKRVAPALPMQDHWLPFSNLDLLLPPVDFSVFFCYRNSKQQGPSMMTTILDTLKKSLAQVLVAYYPLAGEVVMNLAGEPELACNNRGVNFIEAYSDVHLSQLHLHDPHICIENRLVPKKNDGVLCVQVTELKCGGLVVACTFDHRVADAYSANMFLMAWAETAAAILTKRELPLVVPCLRRSLLSPRRPGHYDAASYDSLYASLPPQPKGGGEGAATAKHEVDGPINRLYYITAENMELLQLRASSTGNKRSKMEAFSAFLWQILARSGSSSSSSSSSVVVGDEIITTERCKLGVVVDGRSRLQQQQDDDPSSSSIMKAYFGNVLSIPYGEATAEEMGRMSLMEAANAVHEILSIGTSREHFRGLIDWVETRRPQQFVARVYTEDPGSTAVVVSSGRGFPIKKVDFGWGKPVFGSYHFPWGGYSGYVMPMPSISRDGDWVVYIHMSRRYLQFIDADPEASHFFRPLSPDYLGLLLPHDDDPSV
ncbi:hypothetical protein QJS04_geneDACA014039 [Acorus gramineus]|uniref:Uncharacterized protein n=1 Tax=Acorus gramineus TaxID=55184 RepID=A0AAV9AUS7_ACOGR|nr:hypothetical protein QJS04_geneDACA014039 [Acorus gramineus]